jgi:hypothetical protein
MAAGPAAFGSYLIEAAKFTNGIEGKYFCVDPHFFATLIPNGEGERALE